MGMFSLPKVKWNPDNYERLHSAIFNATQRGDYDTGWVATPANKTFSHNLGVVPAEVWVQASDNPDGGSYSSDTFTVTAKDITIGGPKAYCRVRIHKGA